MVDFILFHCVRLILVLCPGDHDNDEVTNQEVVDSSSQEDVDQIYLSEMQRLQFGKI